MQLTININTTSPQYQNFLSSIETTPQLDHLYSLINEQAFKILHPIPNVTFVTYLENGALYLAQHLSPSSNIIETVTYIEYIEESVEHLLFLYTQLFQQAPAIIEIHPNHIVLRPSLSTL